MWRYLSWLKQNNRTDCKFLWLCVLTPPSKVVRNTFLHSWLLLTVPNNKFIYFTVYKLSKKLSEISLHNCLKLGSENQNHVCLLTVRVFVIWYIFSSAGWLAGLEYVFLKRFYFNFLFRVGFSFTKVSDLLYRSTYSYIKISIVYLTSCGFLKVF